MELQRTLLFAALAMVIFLLWQAWQAEYGPAPQLPAQTQTSAPTASAPGEIPSVATQPAPTSTAVPTAGEQLAGGQRVRVITDVLDLTLDTLGGDVRKVALLDHPVASDKPDQPFVLMSDGGPELFIAQSGFANKTAETPDVVTSAPSHKSAYTVEQLEYRLEPGADSLIVPLTWRSPEGISVTKRYIFRPGSYVIELAHDVVNDSALPWQGTLYQQLQRSEVEVSHLMYTYTGGVIYSPEDKYQKISFDDMRDANLTRDITGGWAAMIQHYFLSAWLPPADQPHHYYTRALGQGRFVIGMYSQDQLVPAGARHTFTNRIYAGPKLQKVLEDVAPGLELTVDYGMLTIIAKPMFWLLDKIHSFVGNWGWSIIILTILIKLAFYKLSETSYKSMAQMKRIGPRMQALKERYGDDKQRMNQALMEMYKKEKINPLGGCLPILIQIPFFIALYWVLLETVELRQAEWILWITDLSIKDPFYVLPVLMGVTMVAQQKLNPAPLDPVQAKIMMALPLVFTVFFAFFPAGLVLYWLVNNALSILQQWYITRVVLKGT